MASLFVLDATTKSITAKLSGSPTTTNPVFVSSWADDTGSALTEGSTDGILNGSSNVTLVASPSGSNKRVIKYITIQNDDTAAVTVSIQYDDNGTFRNIAVVTLQVNDSWTTDGTYDTNGNIKTITTPGSLTLTGDVTGSGTSPITTTVAKIAGTAVTATTGTTNVVFDHSPTLVTPTLGVAAATTINKVTITAPATGSTLTIADGKTLTANHTFTINGGDSAILAIAASKTLTASNSLTLAGTDATTMTFPGTSDTVAGLGTAQTFTAQVKMNNEIDVNNAVTVSSNAGTVPVTFKLNTFTNSSAATMAITMATASAVDGQMTIVRIYDASGVAETIGWTNTENSTVSVPTTSNGSTTLPLTVGFMFNSQTTKWRCIAVA